MSARIMGMSSMPVLTVEDGGAIVRGLALPFDEPAVVTGPQGSLFLEVMDERSVERIAPDLPLLVGHERSHPPAGIVRTAAVSRRGVLIEAELVGSDDELEGWRRRFRAGLSAGLSVGFTQDKSRAVYERPQRRGGLPIVRPRGVVVAEVSLVSWPAYEQAGVTSLSVRTAVDQDHHETSEKAIHEVRMEMIERKIRKQMKEKYRWTP